MWHMMVFADVSRTSLVKVMTFETIRDVAQVLGETPQVVSNFYHRLINPRNAMVYVSLFKD